jgi:multicomponent Na+:H+ antiporter subunit G
LKVFAIVFFIFMASPTATHAITKAALIVGVEPWLKKKRARK